MNFIFWSQNLAFPTLLSPVTSRSMDADCAYLTSAFWQKSCGLFGLVSLPTISRQARKVKARKKRTSKFESRPQKNPRVHMDTTWADYEAGSTNLRWQRNIFTSYPRVERVTLWVSGLGLWACELGAILVGFAGLWRSNCTFNKSRLLLAFRHFYWVECILLTLLAASNPWKKV
jgi:hypothetical protein